MAVEKKQVCEFCGMGFKAVKNHYPHCQVKKLTDEADESIKTGDSIVKGSTTEIEVRKSKLAGIPQDRFWAWTEGLGLQIRVIIDSFTGMTSELREIKNAMVPLIGILEELKNNAGNSYVALKDIKQHLNIVSDSFADAFEIIKHGKIIDEDRVKELAEAVWNENIEKTTPDLPKSKKEASQMLKKGSQMLEKSSPGFSIKPKPKSQEEADLEAFEATQQIETSDIVSGVISYKDDESLPEHTRKLGVEILIVTPKAYQLKFFNGKEAWIPKSTVKSTVDEDNKEGAEGFTQQNFIIDSWVLIKNGVIADNE